MVSASMVMVVLVGKSILDMVFSMRNFVGQVVGTMVGVSGVVSCTVRVVTA